MPTRSSKRGAQSIMFIGSSDEEAAPDIAKSKKSRFTRGIARASASAAQRRVGETSDGDEDWNPDDDEDTFDYTLLPRAVSGPKRSGRPAVQTQEKPKDMSRLETVIANHEEEKAALEKSHTSELEALMDESTELRAEMKKVSSQLKARDVEVSKGKKELGIAKRTINTQMSANSNLAKQVHDLHARKVENEKELVDKDAKIADLEEKIDKAEEGFQSHLAEVQNSRDDLQSEMVELRKITASASVSASETNEQVASPHPDSDFAIPGELHFLRTRHVTDPSSLAYNNLVLLRQCNIIEQGQDRGLSLMNALLTGGNHIYPQFPIAPDCPSIIPSPSFITTFIETELNGALAAIEDSACSVQEWKPFRWMDGEQLMAAYSWTFFQLYQVSADPKCRSSEQETWLKRLYKHYIDSIIANKVIVQEYAASKLVSDQ